MNTITASPPTYESLLVPYLPISIRTMLPHRADIAHPMALVMVHGAVQPVLRDRSRNLGDFLRCMANVLLAIFQAGREWSEALSRFRAEAAPQLDRQISRKPVATRVQATRNAIDEVFLRQYAPQAGMSKSLNAVITDGLQYMNGLNPKSVGAAVRDFEWAIEGLPRAIRAYQLAVLKFAYDSDVAVHGRHRDQRTSEFAFGLEKAFGIEGAWGADYGEIGSRTRHPGESDQAFGARETIRFTMMLLVCTAIEWNGMWSCPIDEEYASFFHAMVLKIEREGLLLRG